MGKYRFSEAERFAVYTVHGERCYICRKPIDLLSTEIDHVIPEQLAADGPRLASALRALGRRADFDLNSPENWLPACRPCNLAKRDTVWDPSLLVQLALQQAANRKDAVRRLVAKTVGERDAARALSVLHRLEEGGNLTAEAAAALGPLLQLQQVYREPELVDTPLRLTPAYEILSESGGIRLVRGRYGVGGRPSMADPDASFDCPTCGADAAWSGARCVVCGQLSDD